MPMRVRAAALLLLLLTSGVMWRPAALPLHLLAAFPPEQAPPLHRGLRRTLTEAGAKDMGASYVLVSNNSLQAIESLCDAVRKQHPSLVLAFLPPRRAFFASLVTGQAGIPLISLSRDYTDIPAQEMNPWYLSLDPRPSDLADAVFHLLRFREWSQVTLLVDDSHFSGSISRRLLSLSAGPPWVSVVRLPGPRDQLLGVLSGVQASARRVLVLCCPAAKARVVLGEARRLRLLDGDWNWILLEQAAMHRDLSSYPIGVLSVRLRHQLSTRHSVRAAMEVVVESVRYLDANRWALEHRNRSEVSCWEQPGELRKRLSTALHTVIRRQMERESPLSREGLETPVFDILNLVPGPNGRPRWKCFGNVTGSRVSMDAVVWLGAGRVGPPLEDRQRFRVVTAFSPPFVQQATRMSNGSCLIGVPCLRVNTSDRHEIAAIFADYTVGRSEGVTYHVACCAGVSIDLLLTLSRDLHFDFDLYLVADGLFGTSRGLRWNGITADLMSGAAHLTLGAFSMTSARQKVIDFSVPYFHSGVSCLTYSQYREVPLSAFLVPFSVQLWVAIFAGLTATAVAAAIYEWFSPFGLNPWGRQRTKNFSLASALWVMWSLLFSHLVAFKAPKSWPNKVLINIWGCFSVIFLASYTANIAALFAGLFFHLRVDDFHDASLLNSRTGTARGSAAEGYVFAENPELWQHIQNYGVATLEEGLDKLRKEELDVLIGDTAVLNYFRGNDPGCGLHLLGDSIFDDAYAVGMHQGFPLKEAISVLLLRYNEYGYLDQLQKKWYGRVPCFDDTVHRFNQPLPLSIRAVAGVFIMLVVGIFVGVAILIMEHLVFKYALPVLRKKPKECLWRSPNLMFFSQKLYRFINTVELVSPHHSAKEIVSNLREGQIASLFQKSVKKKIKEEARRRKSKSQFFDMIQEIRRVVRQQNEPKPPSWEDSRQQLTSPPGLRDVPEEEELLSITEVMDEGPSAEEEENHSTAKQLRRDEDSGSRLIGSYRSYSGPSDEQESTPESPSSSVSAWACRRSRARLSASTGDLAAMQFRENLRRHGGVMRWPRVRSLDDLSSLRKGMAGGRAGRGSSGGEGETASVWHWAQAMDELRLYSMSKEDIVRLWQDSERALLNRLRETLREKRALEERLAFIQKTLLKPP